MTCVLHYIYASETISFSGYIRVLLIWEAPRPQQLLYFHKAQHIVLLMTGANRYLLGWIGVEAVVDFLL